MSLSTVVYGLGTFFIGLPYVTSEETVFYCTEPRAFRSAAEVLWKMSTIVLSILMLIIYCITHICAKRSIHRRFAELITKHLYSFRTRAYQAAYTAIANDSHGSVRVHILRHCYYDYYYQSPGSW